MTTIVIDVKLMTKLLVDKLKLMVDETIFIINKIT
jgi:hypothetical protein